MQAHQNLATPPTRWRGGVILEAGGCHVLVRADPARVPPQIDLLVDGPAGMRRAALNIALNHLDAVHALHRKINPRNPGYPLPDRPDVDVNYDHLLRLEECKGPDHEYLPEGADRDYRVGDLLEGVRRDRVTPSPEKRGEFGIQIGGQH